MKWQLAVGERHVLEHPWQLDAVAGQLLAATRHLFVLLPCLSSIDVRSIRAPDCHSLSWTCHLGLRPYLVKHAAIFPNRPTGPLVARAQRTLGMTHRRFGEALGSSERTALRWARGSSRVSVPQLRTLAGLVHPRDAELAQSIAEACSETLESLGIVAPPPPPPMAPPAPAPLAAHLVADLLVCAAADAIGAIPRTARTALVAAFTRARELGLSVAEAETALVGTAEVKTP